MKCPKCGQEAVGNFCSNCGTPLVNDTVRREQETVGRKPENSYDDGDSEQRNPARMESDEKKAESGSGSKRNSQEKRSSQSQDAQKREEERRDNERCQSQAQEDARRDREAASRRRQDARRSSSSAKEDKRDAKQQKQMEKRLHALESERERSERQKNRMERSHQRELERQSREAERTRRAAERSEAHTQSDSNGSVRAGCDGSRSNRRGCANGARDAGSQLSPDGGNHLGECEGISVWRRRSGLYRNYDYRGKLWSGAVCRDWRISGIDGRDLVPVDSVRQARGW